MADLSVAIKLFLESRQLNRELRKSRGDFKHFSSGIKSEAAAINRSFQGILNVAAGLGISFGVAATAVKSAKLDEDLIRLRQTAQGTREEMEELRGTLFQLSIKTGRPVEELKSGFEKLTASGLSWIESARTIPAVNDALAVTGANVESLAAGLTVGAKQFDVDLTRVGAAADLLDKFTVAGRLANAEIEDLSDIFARVGGNAKRAGLDLDSTLAVVESFSKFEVQPERLATLVDSTLRLFTNGKVSRTVSKKTGVKFFDAEGSRRDAIDVLKDIAEKYKKLKTDLQRESFLENVLPNADLDTKKGFSQLLGDGNIQEIREFTRRIRESSGTIKRGLDEALDNAVAQTGRLKSALGEAADEFARPINDAVAKAIQYALDSKEKGGLDLSGKEILAGGAGIAIAGTLGGRLGSKALKALSGKAGGLAGGVATGKALEHAAGVQPVYVVNMPGDFGGSGGIGAGAAAGAGAASVSKNAPNVLKGAKATMRLFAGATPAEIAALGPGAVATAGAGVAAAGAAGYGAGTLLYKAIEGTQIADKIGEAVARALAAFGNQEAKISLEIRDSEGTSTRVTGQKGRNTSILHRRGGRGSDRSRLSSDDRGRLFAEIP